MNDMTEMPAPLTFSDNAAAKVKSLIDEEGNPDLKLRVFVTGGGCSGFQLVNLAAQAGARGIVLVGFDMDSSQPPHWYGKNTWPGSSNPKERSFVRWRRALDGAAATLSKLSIEVVNVSETSTLTAYPKMKLEDALWLLKA